MSAITQRVSSNRFQFLAGSHTMSSPEKSEHALDTSLLSGRDASEKSETAGAAQAEPHRHPFDTADSGAHNPMDDGQTEPRLPHDASIFVANLPAEPQDYELENMLKGHFSDIAKIMKVKIIHNAQTTPRCAFLQCETSEQAKQAVLARTNSIMGGSSIRCEAAKAHRALFISLHRHTDAPKIECIGLRRDISSRHVEVFLNQEALTENVAGPPSVSLGLSRAESTLIAFNPSTNSLFQSVEKLLQFFGPLEQLHPHRSSWHHDVFLPHPPPLPLRLPINEAISTEYVGPWEVKFESRDDAVSAKRTLEKIQDIIITWVHAHPRPFGRPRGPWQQPLTNNCEAGLEHQGEYRQPIALSNNMDDLGDRLRPTVEVELSAAELRDSFKFPPRLSYNVFDRQNSQRPEELKQQSAKVASSPSVTTAPRMTEFEFPPLDRRTGEPTSMVIGEVNSDQYRDDTKPVVVRQTFAKVTAPVTMAAEDQIPIVAQAIAEGSDVGTAPSALRGPPSSNEGSRSLYIPHLSRSEGWTTQRLLAIFSHHEGFERAVLKTDFRLKKKMLKAWHGIVEFDTKENAAKALDLENGREHFGVVFQIDFKRSPRHGSSIDQPSVVLPPDVTNSGTSQENLAQQQNPTEDEPKCVSDVEPRDADAQVGEDKISKPLPTVSQINIIEAPAAIHDLPVVTSKDTEIVPNGTEIKTAVRSSPSLEPLSATSTLVHVPRDTQEESQESPSTPAPLKNRAIDTHGHRRSSSDPHVHFKLPSSALSVAKDVQVVQVMSTHGRRVSAGRETIEHRVLPVDAPSPSSLRGLDDTAKGGLPGKRTPTWHPTAGQSGLSSPEGLNGTSSDTGSVEIVSGEEGQLVTAPGMWPYSGLVYILPPSSQYTADGHPGHVPQAKGFVDTEHGLLPIYSPEAIAPYTREAFPCHSMSPASTHPWGHMPPYLPAWGPSGYWMPGMGMPTPAPYGTATSGSPAIHHPPPFAHSLGHNFSHNLPGAHQDQSPITPSAPAYAQSSPRQHSTRGVGRHQLSQYRRNGNRNNNSNHYLHLNRQNYHHNDTFDSNMADPALYYQYQYQQQHQQHQNSSHQNQHQHSPPQYNLSQQHPYYIPDQQTYPSTSQHSVYPVTTLTEGSSPAYV
ncbi:hypothetical protein FRB93_013169 [Tulasnella sp. JGI-2019a]|nr:hypothetical protein FRB93_013169 [Tulasnella sp. JGI-2019a]